MRVKGYYWSLANSVFLVLLVITHLLVGEGITVDETQELSVDGTKLSPIVLRIVRRVHCNAIEEPSIYVVVMMEFRSYSR